VASPLRKGNTNDLLDTSKGRKRIRGGIATPEMRPSCKFIRPDFFLSNAVINELALRGAKEREKLEWRLSRTAGKDKRGASILVPGREDREKLSPAVWRSSSNEEFTASIV